MKNVKKSEDFGGPDPYQVVPNAYGYTKRCPICGTVMDHTLVDDGEEVVVHYVCANCGYSESVVRK